ncbi:MAG: transglycosylase SLT domain-containing protein [Gemmatimonadota bacterium]
MTPRRTFPLSKLNRKSVKIPLALAAAAAAIGTATAGSLAGPASASTGSPAVAHAQAGAARNAAVSQLFPGGRAADLPAPHAGTVRLVVAKGRHAAPAAAPRQARGVAHPRQPQHRAAQRSVCHAAGLNRWICQADSILVQHGVPQSKLSADAARIVVMHESGGNPHASNGWDANAAAGTPSEGIAQTIAPTFNTYALPGHHNIWNPVDNMVAAFRYAISRYGSMNNIPGVVSVRSGGSYMGY